MKRTPRALVVTSFLLAACGSTSDATEIPEGPASADTPADGTDPVGQGTDPGTDPGTKKPVDPKLLVADLRADVNRDGVVGLDDEADDKNEDTWDAAHGAVFLANIDDDEEACTTQGVDDVDLPKCNDAADSTVNGAEDARDLARIKLKAWPLAPEDTTATITVSAPDAVRLFVVRGTSFELFDASKPISAADVRSGLELAIEAKDIVRDPALWDGYVDLSLEMKGGGQSGTDKLRLRVAPLITYHHLSAAESTWVSLVNAAGNTAMRSDLAEAATAAGVPAPKTIQVSDQWTQDFFETAYMSMPAAGGQQHAIRVAIRSANQQNPNSTRNPLRPAGRAAFALMRGKDAAAIQQFDAARRGRFDTLNSFGNLETIPPYTYDGKSYPLGRVLRGSTPTYYVDQVFTKMMEAQNVQPPVYIDTSWLLVGHVDETLSFVKASSPRGWVALVNDARLARDMLQQQADAGYGNTPMFVGKYWDSQSPAQQTINQVLSDTDVMSASAEAAAEVDDQVAALKAATGLTDAELIRIPYLHMTESGRSVAYQPGMVNGLYLSPTHFVAPDPHGPSINGTDIFKAAMQSALAPLGITVHFAEDWDTYHRNLGEVHCGTNSVRQVPAAKWWESGR